MPFCGAERAIGAFWHVGRVIPYLALRSSILRDARAIERAAMDEREERNGSSSESIIIGAGLAWLLLWQKKPESGKEWGDLAQDLRLLAKCVP